MDLEGGEFSPLCCPARNPAPNRWTGIFFADQSAKWQKR